MEDKESLCGVYYIGCEVDGKRYVGQTLNSFDKRRSQHISKLNKGIHNNPHLQNAWNKYGESAFTFEIIEICETLEECNDAEKFWTYTFRSLNRKFGYNIRNPGSNGRMSEETKLKISKANLGKEISYEARQKMSEAKLGKKIIQ